MQNIQINLEKRVGMMNRLAQLGKKAAVVVGIVLGATSYGCGQTSECCEKLNCRTGYSMNHSYFCDDGGNSNCITTTKGEKECCYCDSVYDPSIKY